ncbi:hypothetical protein HUG10_05945 [Halorarum halophilum]|uniref:Uncharacterized protein n=1 Tax=Halorarum halophilum TaxID=2743090 RepID=A0A7D5GYX4_9EURY|nr:hypothetical protein [Halobaculum halophilum]QLG27113.1 hypothetical protein HUG10_05945 [Halobaculum halophilum]
MDSAEGDGTPEPSGENFARRVSSRNRVLEWVLVDGNRLVVTFIATVLFLVLLLVCYSLGVIAFANANSITRMASGMIAGTFSLVTLVVSVNQLILSQEFSPAGEFRDRLGGVMDFRRDVEGVTGVPAAPAEPTRLLELLVAAVRHRADVLADTVVEHDEESGERVVEYATSVIDSTERIETALDQKGVTAFDALSAAIEYDNDWQLYAARHLQNDTSSFSGETDHAFDELIEALQLFNTAQEHFKTVYLQRELTRFSQLTIYTGVLALLAAILIIPLYGDLGGATISPAYLPYVVSLLATVVFVPLALLASYILRTTTVTRRTAAIGPMLPQKDPEEGPFEVSYEGTD